MMDLNGCLTHVVDTGASDGPVVVFSNSLGTDLRIWDRVVAMLPAGWRTVRYDTVGHGLSDCPAGPYDMGDLVGQAAALLDALGLSRVVFVGLSVGGIIAQGLAAERPERVRGMVLSNTGAKIGTDQIWNDRIETVRESGIAALQQATMERWFSARFRQERAAELAGWRHMLVRTPAEGYTGCSAAIRDTDLWESTARLTLPTLAIAGSEDGATPPDLVRETAGLIEGAAFELLQGAGHLPCVEAPGEVARLVTAFVEGLDAA